MAPTPMADLALPPPDRARLSSPRTLFGEPIGLGYLSITKARELFSYYGVTALLVLHVS
jgi:proton-dependent oligopeptide transporter, POT family